MPNVDRTNRRWKNRHLVRERDAQRARRLWATLALVVAALAPGGLYLYEQNSCLQLSYEIESIEGQREQLAEAERRLEVRHAGVASMKSIERWAAKQRLERPTPEEIVVVPYEAVNDDPMLARVPDGTIETAPRRPRRLE
jgi:cytochrome c-type biogenesis protein CcmE